jgi:hypothetical protein
MDEKPTEFPYGVAPPVVIRGKAIKPPPGTRIRPKKFARFDDPVIPQSYWYLTAGIGVAAVVVGLLIGRFLLI